VSDPPGSEVVYDREKIKQWIEKYHDLASNQAILLLNFFGVGRWDRGWNQFDILEVSIVQRVRN
jgi:hypothetical protein